MRGSFTVAGSELAAAVKYCARWLTTRPMIPAHGGLLFEVDGDRLNIFGFNENVTARATVEIDASDEPKGAFVVAGRLVDALAAALPKGPVRFEQDGPVVAVTAGRARYTLPAMSEKDYPALPGAAALAGHVDGDELADAVRRVGVAAKREAEKEIAFCGIHVQLDEDYGFDAEGEQAYTLTLTATDRYRGAKQTIPWRPDAESAPIGDSFLVLASVLGEAVEAFAGADVALGVEGGVASLTSPARSLVVGTLDQRGFPAAGLAGILASEPPDLLTVRARDLTDPLKRIGLFIKRPEAAAAAAAHVLPVQIDLAENLLTLIAPQGSTGGGDEEIDVEYDGPPTSMILNATYLQAMLQSAPDETVTLAFRAGQTKPIIVSTPSHPTWRHLLQPLKDLGGTS